MDHPRLEYSDPLPGDFRHPLYTDPNYLKKIPRTFGRANIEFHFYDGDERPPPPSRDIRMTFTDEESQRRFLTVMAVCMKYARQSDTHLECLKHIYFRWLERWPVAFHPDDIEMARYEGNTEEFIRIHLEIRYWDIKAVELVMEPWEVLLRMDDLVFWKHIHKYSTSIFNHMLSLDGVERRASGGPEQTSSESTASTADSPVSASIAAVPEGWTLMPATFEEIDWPVYLGK